MTESRSPIPSAGRILVADDVAANRELIVTLLRRDGYTVDTVNDGAAALAALEREVPDLVITDVMMPHVDGFELCRHVKSAAATRLIPVVIVTALDQREDRLKGINAGADDFLTKPLDALELRARVGSLVRLKRYTDDLDSAESVILSLALTVEARDAYTGGHCERMAAYAAAFGAHLGRPEEDVAALRRGGYLHDVGKVGIPDAILFKPGRLTPEEFDVIKRHTTIGEALCGNLRILRAVRPIVRSHHEKDDGTGYPDGLRGGEIPPLAEIMGIVDVYDALTTDRVYRAAMARDDACAELRAEAARGWRRRELVEEFIAMVQSGRFEGIATPPASQGSSADGP